MLAAVRGYLRSDGRPEGSLYKKKIMLSYYKQKENREKCSEVGAEKLADDLVPWSEKLPESIRKPKKSN